MSVQAARRWTNRPAHSGRYSGEVMPDRGCHFAPACASCPWTKCLLEDAREAERRELAEALRVVKRWVRAPDGTIALD
jgi:hypothetical protein